MYNVSNCFFSCTHCPQYLMLWRFSFVYNVVYSVVHKILTPFCTQQNHTHQGLWRLCTMCIVICEKPRRISQYFSHNIIMVIIIIFYNPYNKYYIHIIHTALKAPSLKGMLCTKLLEILIHIDVHIMHKINIDNIT